MRPAAGLCLLLALATAGARSAFAQAPQAAILTCSVDAPGGPAVVGIQTSAGLAARCESPDEDDAALCRTVDAAAAETSCASALATLNAVGTAEAANHTKAFLPSNFRVDPGNLPTDDAAALRRRAIVDALLRFARQPDVVYALKAPSQAVSLVACDFSETAPRLVYLQDGDGAVADTDGAMSCADGLEDRFAQGATVADAVVTHGWDPVKKEVTRGSADDGASHPEVGDEVLVEFIHNDPNRIVYVYRITGGNAP